MNRGFTLIETLVVISVTIVLATIVISYNHVGERQIILFKEQAKVISVINRAKALSLQFYTEENPPCGYGAHFSKDSGSYLIFRDLSSDCGASDNIYSGENELFEKYQLDSRIKFSEINFSDVFFVPPDPVTIINPGEIEKGSIILGTINGEGLVKIEVTDAGQITID